MNKKIRLLQVIPDMGTGGAETGCKHIAEYISTFRTVNTNNAVDQGNNAADQRN